ncbi:MAG: hypothetical protein WC662_05000 [Candidatus Paceibacterota bacterium]|jgi:hypothetical protein
MGLILFLSFVAFIVGLCLIYNPEVGKWKFQFEVGIFLLISSFALPLSTCLLVEKGAIAMSVIGFVLLILVAVIIIIGIIDIPNTPKVHVAIIKKYGNMEWKGPLTTVSKEHGTRFLFLRGIVFTFDLLDITDINVDRPDEEIITPDDATNFVPVSYTVSPGAKSVRENGTEYINYYYFIKKGKEKKVINIFDDKVGEKIREYASIPGTTWRTLRGSGDVASLHIIKMIAGEYTTEQQFNPTAEELQLIRAGNGTQPIDKLSITLSRLNIGRIKVDAALEKALNDKTKEEAEREAERIEQAWIKECVMGYLFEQNPDGSLKEGSDGKPIKRDVDIKMNEVVELVQSERGKIKKDVNIQRKEYKLDNDTISTLALLATAVIKEIKKKETL